jgi:hypothetical protein
VQQHLSQQEIQRIGMSVQVPSTAIIDKLKIAPVVLRFMTELSEAVTEKDKNGHYKIGTS